MQQFHIDAAAFSQFSGIYYIGYSLVHLPVGILLDRYGPKRIMSGCIFLTVLGLFPLLFATNWIYPVIGRCLIGVGSSAAILSVFKIIRMAFKEEQFPRLLSFSVMIGLIGAIYGGGPVNYLLHEFGYQTVIYLFVFLGIALALLSYWITPHMTSAPTTSVVSNIKEIIKNPKVVLSCLFAGFMVGPLEGFADVWGTAFLKQLHHIDGNLAASLPSVIFIGMCFGSPVLNFIAEKTKSYPLTIIGAAIVMILSFAGLLMGELSSGSITILFAVIGVCCAYQILAIYKASTYVREEISGLTTAIANMIIVIFGYVFHTTIGNIVHAAGGPNNPSALFYGVMVVPIGLCVGALGFILLSLYTKKQKSPLNTIYHK